MSKDLKIEDIKEYSKSFKNSKNNQLLSNIVRKVGILDSVYNYDEACKIQNVFNVEVKDSPSIEDQKRSGRCWMFSGLNVVRQIVAKALGVKNIELSHTHLFFYDKLEKANMLYERAIELIDMNKESREFQFLITNGANQDGGWWHQFKDLIKKYGIVPLSVSPEVYHSNDSSYLDQTLTLAQVKGVDTLKTLRKNGATYEELEAKKSELLKDIYKIVAISLGEPVNKFNFSYVKTNEETKKDEVIEIKSTPLDFFNTYVKTELDDYVNLVNYPSVEKPFYQRYFNIGSQAQSGEEFFSLNLPIEELKTSAIASLKDGNCMWFACDVITSSFTKEGILSTEAYNLGNLFNINFDMDKYERLRYFASSPCHAMTLSGVNLDKKGNPNRWKINNSWGTDRGFSGIYIMSDKWFDEYVYSVVVNKKYLSDKAKASLNSKIITLDPWDPLA